MKSLKTMHEVVTDTVRRIGPRMDRETGRYGYYATVGEIKEIYYRNGFSRRAKRTIPSHIEAWAYVGYVGFDGGVSLSEDATIVWWPCMTDRTALTIAAERILADPSKLVLEPPAVDFGGL